MKSVVCSCSLQIQFRLRSDLPAVLVSARTVDAIMEDDAGILIIEPVKKTGGMVRVHVVMIPNNESFIHQKNLLFQIITDLSGTVLIIDDGLASSFVTTMDNVAGHPVSNLLPRLDLKKLLEAVAQEVL